MNPPITFSYDPKTRIRTAVFQDGVTDDDLVSAFTKLFQSPDIDPFADDLTDLRLVKKIAITSDGLQRLLSLFSGIEKPAELKKLAIVGETDMTFGVSRIYQIMGENIVPKRIQVFRTIDEAMQWLLDKESKY
ncbi:MAG: hypothetical protein PHP42_05770 [Bacteroidota bacterium]|nr:hypothetical protein [Bacteroidota bacterium]